MTDVHSEFMRAFIRVEPRLRTFAIACGLRLTEVDDLVQETALVLWRKFDEYDSARPFLPWALGISRNLIHEVRHAERRTARPLSPRVTQKLVATCTRVGAQFEMAEDALQYCVEKLPPRQQELISLRYREELTLKQIANRLRQGLSGVNMALRRLRFALLECMQRRLQV